MAGYALRRVATTIPVLFAILTLVFLMRPLVPGDPVAIMFFGRSSSPEVVANMRHQLGLDDPLPIQYVRYLGDVLRGDLGTSITTRQPVVQEIAERFPATLQLALGSLAVSCLVGLVAGILAAVYKDTAIDTAAMVFAMAGLSMPGFWFGLVMIYFFSVRLGWFSVIPDGSLKSLVLPALTLGLIASSVVARLVRSAMLEVLGQDFIRTARAKGLRERRVLLRHALGNAMIPVVTIIGLQFGGLLSGAFIIEAVFAWHGIGELAVDALGKRDFPLIQGIVLVIATSYVLVNLLVDLLYAVLDPRITYS
ncbi:MAG: ABC transporter, permease protein 1 (cluster 5, nickel/peptides/opines) [uncultured Thermomicrobiales bacterium]|uniref:ABC transporter, permease protein 1 (Cluster 5, nickel/peptides/opines) n=1 Tax=uncultured Thermomicrobiales bacterium TaxID=1645740 RepID=A0A6J4VNS8_9BACT|nr:MAG: ABC transporter, permease protein 1 (cluster 5, nickel/peptides/opines) [uncultured Thermomicrobiales bacterium]